MTDPATIVLVVVLYSLGAVVMHELTHYVAALLYNRKPEIDWVAMDCIWLAPDETDASRKRDETIRAAPVLVGMVMVPAVHAVVSGPVTAMNVVRLWAWVVYTMPVPLPLVGGIGASLGDWNGVLRLMKRSWGRETEV